MAKIEVVGMTLADWSACSLFAYPIPQLRLLGIQPQTEQLPQPGWALGNAGWAADEIDQVQGKSDHERHPK
jgi:hypothetical protein